MIKAFIFDVDGTLVDTRQLHIASWLEALKSFGIDITEDEAQPQFGKRSTEIAKALIPKEMAIDAKMVADEKKRIFSTKYSLVKPMPMVKELFIFLAERGIKIGLATSANRRDMQFYMDNIFMRDLIGSVITGDDIQYSKPHPEIFLKVAMFLEVDPKECVAIGDSPYDMTSAKSASMVALGVLTGGYSEEELKLAGADRIYKDIADLYDHIQSLV